MDFFDHLRSLGISEEEIRKMRDEYLSLHYINFDLFEKKYYVIMYT